MLASLTPRRPLLLIGIAAVSALLLLEIASYGFIVVAGKNFFLPLALNDLSEETLPEPVKARFSHELGWEPHHLNDYGYRGPEKSSENAILAVFGDGYAQGNQTLEQSWPYLLEQELGRPVFNFGVGAYGPGQAYLRFEEHYGEVIQTPYAALIMMSGAMARVMNRYRGFYARGKDIRYPKPMFKAEDDGGVELIRNPLQSSNELVKLADPEFLEELGEGDFWYAKFDGYGMNEFVGFPYAYHLAKAAPYYVARWRDHATTDRQSFQILYENDDAKAALRGIVERFIKRSKEEGAIPIFVLLPNAADLGQYLERGTTSYEDVLGDIKQIDHPYIYDGLDFYEQALEGGAKLESFFIAKGNDQLSPMAEKLVGEAMHGILTSIEDDSAKGTQ